MTFHNILHKNPNLLRFATVYYIRLSVQNKNNPSVISTSIYIKDNPLCPNAQRVDHPTCHYAVHVSTLSPLNITHSLKQARDHSVHVHHNRSSQVQFAVVPAWCCLPLLWVNVFWSLRVLASSWSLGGATLSTVLPCNNHPATVTHQNNQLYHTLTHSHMVLATFFSFVLFLQKVVFVQENNIGIIPSDRNTQVFSNGRLDCEKKTENKHLGVMKRK